MLVVGWCTHHSPTIVGFGRSLSSLRFPRRVIYRRRQIKTLKRKGARIRSLTLMHTARMNTEAARAQLRGLSSGGQAGRRPKRAARGKDKGRRR
jgi:hypothetical protein